MSVRRMFPAGPIVALLGRATFLASAPPGPAEEPAPPALGSPHHISFAVPDVAAARDLLARATGTRFGPVSAVTVPVRLDSEQQPRTVTLHRSLSVRDGTLLELVEADPPIGPWATTGSSPALSYAVPDVQDPVLTGRLRSAGLRAIAGAPGFEYWQGAGGVTIRLIGSDVVPTPRKSDQPPAVLDLGPAATLTMSPYAAAEVRRQLSAALGVKWAPPLAFPFIWVWAGGTRSAMIATVLATHGEPADATRLVMETPHHAPRAPEYACSPGNTPAHLAFFSADLPAADRQMTDAGMRLIGRVPGLISYFDGPGGVRIEVARSVFKAAVPVIDLLGRLTGHLRTQPK